MKGQFHKGYLFTLAAMLSMSGSASAAVSLSDIFKICSERNQGATITVKNGEKTRNLYCVNRSWVPEEELQPVRTKASAPSAAAPSTDGEKLKRCQAQLSQVNTQLQTLMPSLGSLGAQQQKAVRDMMEQITSTVSGNTEAASRSEKAR